MDRLDLAPGARDDHTQTSKNRRSTKGESMTASKLATFAAGAALILAAGAAHAQVPTGKNDYSRPETWLCWPGKAGDACAVDLTTTVVKANGSEAIEAFKAD